MRSGKVDAEKVSYWQKTAGEGVWSDMLIGESRRRSGCGKARSIVGGDARERRQKGGERDASLLRSSYFFRKSCFFLEKGG
jgi:hypothetical protein